MRTTIIYPFDKGRIFDLIRVKLFVVDTGSFWLGRRDDGWWQWTRRRRCPLLLLLLYRLIQGDNGFEPEQCIDGPAGKNGLTVPF